MIHKKKKLTTQAILRATSVCYNLTPEKMTQHTRKKEIVQPRQVAQYLAHRFQVGTLRQIAEETGLSNHASILHSSKTIANEVELYEDRRDDVQEIIQRLKLMGYNLTVEKPCVV